MFYRGDTIYSYGTHWPLGRKVTLSDSGRTVALINDIHYSRSTARHACRVRGAARQASLPLEMVEYDLFHTVSDEASLAKARHVTKERLLDRIYESRIAANERAKRARERNGEQARRDLEKIIDVDFDGMSLSAAVKLRNLLIGVPKNNFMSISYYSSGVRRGGFVEQFPGIKELLTQVITEDPGRLKTPGFLFTLIENFKLLAA
jgi:hypothetical protein